MGGFLSGVQNLGHNLMSGLKNFTAGTPGDIANRQQQLEERQQYQRQQQADLDFAEHMNQVGALPIYPGSNAVRESFTTPPLDPSTAARLGIDPSTGAGQTFTTTRPADSSRIVKHKTAEGDTVQWELPTPEQQQQKQLALALNQARGMQPVASINAQETGQEAQAKAAGTLAGQSQSRQADIAARGVRLGDLYDTDTLKKFGMNPDYRDVPENIDKVIPAGMRGVTSQANTGQRVQGQKDVAQMRIDATQALQDQKDQAAADRDQNKLDYQNRWQAARNAITSSTQSSLNNRLGLRMFDLNQAQHGKLQDQIYNETQKQLDAQALLDPKMTPDNTPDNPSTFTDPWSGKKMTMNAAQRLRLKNAIGKSQGQVADWQNRAQQIEQKYGLTGQQAPGGAGQPGGAQPDAVQPAGARPAGGSPAPAAAPASSQPGGANSGGSGAKVVTRAQVAAAAQKLGVDVNTATQRYQKLGYKIQ